MLTTVVFEQPASPGITAACGRGVTSQVKLAVADGDEPAVLGAGDYLTITADGSQESRSPRLDVIVVGGRPIREPLAWAGPFVMNTRSEVMQAYEDFQRGHFGHVPA